MVSTAILDEYREVVGRPKHAAYRNEALTFIAELEEVGILVDPDDPPSLPDCDDAVYVATARAGEAEILITGNVRHFPLDLCLPVTIFSPRDFFERLMT
ncbi:MAG: PIN domain-containing protein [Alphaproteobacteria bacterium]|nr:PIN domain-containing protein [Alphaproteobacteria bacterium]